MHWEYVISGVGTVGLLVAAAMAVYGVAASAKRAAVVSVFAALAVVAVDFVRVATPALAHGAGGAMRQSYESNLLLAGLIALVGVLGRRTATLRGVDVILFVVAAVVQFASLFQIGVPGIGVEYKSWFISHPLAFALGATCYAGAGAAGAVYLLVERLLRRKRQLTLVGRLAPLESLERFGRWALTIGFPCVTYGVLTGFCQLVRQHNPGPLDWLLDPVVVFTLVLWVVYAVAAFAIWFRPRMRGRRGAFLSAVSVAVLVVGFIVAGHLSTLHR
jgi:ABC-type uncharacterized transport system permease subunit